MSQSSNGTEPHKTAGTEGRADATGRVAGRSAETQEQYASVRRRLGADARRDLATERVSTRMFAHWYASQDGLWTKGTIRVYRAALRNWYDNVPEGAIDPDVIDLFEQGPEPKPDEDSRDKRRRVITRKQFEKFTAAALATGKKEDLLALGYVYLSVCFFPRPKEWQDAHVEGDNLVFRTLKTKGDTERSERRIDLSEVDADTIVGLGKLIANLQSRAASDGWTKIYGRLAARIRRICERVDIPPIAPYTCRHVGYAQAKKELGRVVAAAMAGHTDVASCSNYAPARSSSGLSPIIMNLRPDRRSLERVHKNARKDAGKPFLNSGSSKSELACSPRADLRAESGTVSPPRPTFG